MVGGQIFTGVNSIGEKMRHYKANKFRVIRICGDKRNALAPETPTIIKRGAKMPPIGAGAVESIPALLGQLAQSGRAILRLSMQSQPFPKARPYSPWE
jgi:hypothetical protein